MHGNPISNKPPAEATKLFAGKSLQAKEQLKTELKTALLHAHNPQNAHSQPLPTHREPFQWVVSKAQSSVQGLQVFPGEPDQY